MKKGLKENIVEFAHTAMVLFRSVTQEAMQIFLVMDASSDLVLE